MRYRYGDSTPFPLEEDFLQTVTQVTETCVGLLRIDAAVREARTRIGYTTSHADQNGRWLANLRRAVAQVIRESPRPASTQAAQEAERIIDAFSRMAEDSQRRVVSQRDQLLGQLETSIVEQRGQIVQHLERLLLRHTLPDTEWGISWRAEGDQAFAEALSIAPCGLEASFALELPAAHPWARPVRVSDLGGELRAQLPRQAGRIRRAESHQVKLSRYFITAVDLAAERQTLTLKRRAREPSSGYDIWCEEDGVTILALEPSESVGAPIHLRGTARDGVHALVARIRADLEPLVSSRRELTDAVLKGVALRELDSPSFLAQVLIDAVAPLVRELVLRSPSAEELCLKRDLGDGRREEVFIPISAITDQIALLPAEQRVFFDPFGISPPVLPLAESLNTPPLRLVPAATQNGR